MSIDSVGGGSRDADAVRARRLQEERAAAIKETQDRAEHELEHLKESRKQQLEDVYESQSRDIEARRHEAADRVEVVKADAEARTRAFEADSQKLTEEAKRQFQSKAMQLQRTAGELEKQRELLIKNHERSMEKIRDSTLSTEAATQERNTREAAQSHLNQLRRIEELNDRGEYEVSRIKDSIEDQKRHAISEGATKVRNLQEDYQDNSNQIQKQIDFSKRAGEEQVAKERENLKTNQQRLEQEADDRTNRLSLETQRALNRMHFDGNRKVMETQNQFARQLSEAEKSTRGKIQQQNQKAAFTMASLKSEADAQEAIARTEYANQKGALANARDKSIADNISANEKLQNQLRADYDKRTRVQAELTNEKLFAQFAADDAELRFHRDEGRKAINTQVARDAQTVAAHGSKSADPFYRVHEFGTQVADGELETVVQLRVPEHEQDSVRISRQRDSITVSGTRRFQDKVKLEDGHEASTSAYQSYTESFPVRGKLEMNNMTRSYADGLLTFRIPKG